jgi:nucleotide-binding universal stress UspA family protein
MYQRILVPVDGSSTSTRGLDEAVKLAQITHADLRLVHLVDDCLFSAGFDSYAVYAGDIIPAMREAGAKVLQDAKARALAAGIEADTQLIEGMALRLCDVLLEQVQAWDADLIVIGTHGRRGVGRLFLGSDAEKVLRTSKVPVLLVRAPEERAAEASPAIATKNKLPLAA